MTTDRLIRIIAGFAVASGVIAAASVAGAQDGGSDRALMFQGTHRQQAAPDATEEALVASVEPVVPLPPRRPKGLEAVELASVPGGDAATVSGSASGQDASAVRMDGNKPAAEDIADGMRPSVTEGASPVAMRGQAVAANGAFAISATPMVAAPALSGARFEMPVSAQRPQTAIQESVAADRVVAMPAPPERPAIPADAVRQSGAAEAPAAMSPAVSIPGATLSTVSVSTPPAPVPSALPAVPEEVPAVSASAPLPPQRPQALEAEGAEIQVTSVPAQQEQPGTANGSSSGGFFQKLFDAPQEARSEAVVEAPSNPRSLSKLNHIIGDDPRRAAELRSLIHKHAAANGIPFKFADAVVRVESRYNSRARNGPYVGLMQIHPRTARALGYSGDATGLFDPDTNLQYGIKYLAMAYRLANGDTCGTIMRYQGGHRAVAMSSTARKYCSKVKMIFAENLY